MHGVLQNAGKFQRRRQFFAPQANHLPVGGGGGKVTVGEKKNKVSVWNVYDVCDRN